MLQLRLLDPPPGAGGVAATFDVPDFTATIDHFYRLDVTEPGDYDDYGRLEYRYRHRCACLPKSTRPVRARILRDPTVSGNKPETGTFTLPAGTHTLWVKTMLETRPVPR